MVAGGITWYEYENGLAHRTAPIQPIGETQYIYHGHHSNVNAIAWSQDNSFIVLSSSPFTLTLWRNASTQQRLALLSRNQAKQADAGIHVWSPASGHLLTSYQGHTGGAASVTLSGNSKVAASGGLYDGTVQVWKPRSGQHLLTHTEVPAAPSTTATKSPKTPANSMPPDGAIWAIAWSPDGTLLASGDELHQVQVWDPLTGKVLLTYNKHQGPINALAWSPDGTQIVSASADNSVRVWNVSNGGTIQVYTSHAQDVRAVLWAADGQSILSGGADHVIWVWDATNGNPFWLYRGHRGSINALQWSPDNGQLLSASDDKTVRLWSNWQNGAGKSIYTYSGHSEPVLSATWSGDGTRIASGSSDKTVRIWNARSN